MLTLAMILDNPGEQPHQTRYRDPKVLRSLGYSDLVVFPTNALCGLLGPDTVAAGDLRNWVAEQYEAVQDTVAAARSAGMGAWLTFDAPSLASELVGSAMACVGQPDSLCPASPELFDMIGQCADALLERIRDVEGVVLRLGDSDAPKVPYLLGNDVYTPHCPRCAPLGRGDRMVRFIEFFYDLIVRKLGLKLIVRAWNVKPNGMHDNPELCARVVERLPRDERLILSFKFTQTDFWRYQKWNPSSLLCGDRPIIYELQCQREFEGKGAVPDYQPPLWCGGMPELNGSTGLSEVSTKVNLAGLIAWVRGGGWRGPYIAADRETWIDANVYAVPKIAENPRIDLASLTRSWITERLGVCDPTAADVVSRTLHHSTQTALEMFYVGAYATRRQDPWHPSGDMIQDDQIDAEAVWSIVQQLSDQELDAAVKEKTHAEQCVAEDRRALQRVAAALGRPTADVLIQSMEYAETLAQTLRHLVAGLAAYRRHHRRQDAGSLQAAINALRQCQSAWSSHTGRAAGHAHASAFASDNLWDFTQRIIERVHDEAA